MNNVLSNFLSIKTFIFDVDGVLTNNHLLILEDGSLLRQMFAPDGLALKLALDAGYKIAIITGGKSEGVIKRLNNLGIFDIYSGIDKKINAYYDLLTKYHLNSNEILYMGDDIIDYEVMQKVGLAACPSDANFEIQQISKYISKLEGGKGCVRDVIEKTMRLQNTWINLQNF